MSNHLVWYFGVALLKGSDPSIQIKQALERAGWGVGNDLLIDPSQRSVIVRLKDAADWGIVWRGLAPNFDSDFWTITVEAESPISEVPAPIAPWWHSLKPRTATVLGDKVKPILLATNIYKGDGSLWKSVGSLDANGVPISWDVWNVDKSGERIFVLLESLPKFPGGLYVKPESVSLV